MAKADIKALIKMQAAERSIKQAKEWNKQYANKKKGHEKRKERYSSKPVNNPKFIIESYGEVVITTFLNLNNIAFVPEKTFKGLVSKKKSPLKYDFYLVNENALIEYDGKHHFEKTSYCKDISKVKYHDRLKNEYAIKNNIPLLRLRRPDLGNLKEIVFTFLDSIGRI